MLIVYQTLLHLRATRLEIATFRDATFRAAFLDVLKGMRRIIQTKKNQIFKRKPGVMEVEKRRESSSVNKPEPEMLEIERKFPYFGRLSVKYESAREQFSMPTREEIRAARGKEGEANVALYKYWLDDDTMNAIVQKEVEEMDEKDKDRFYVFPISVWVSIKSTSEAEHPKHPADRYQLTKSAIWPNSNFKKVSLLTRD